MISVRASTPRRNLFGQRDLLGVLLLLALWLGIAATLLNLGFYDGLPLTDDAFYYLEIARNASQGQGFTFDSIHPTNGFHPLWAGLLVPIFWLFPDSPWIPIRCALLLSACCVAATGAALFYLFRRRGLSQAGILACLIWLFNPFTFVLAFQGMEEPLSVLCLSLSFLSLDSIRQGRPQRIGPFVWLGVSAGIAFLARTENLLWILTVILFVLAERPGMTPTRSGLLRGGIVSLIAGLTALPWLAWNLLTFGTLVQTSSAAKQMFHLYGGLPGLGWPSPDSAPLLTAPLGFIRNLGQILLYLSKFIVNEDFKPPELGLVFLASWSTFFLLFLVAPLLLCLKRQEERPHGFLAPLGLFSLFHLVAYGALLRSYASWYAFPLLLGLAAWHAHVLIRVPFKRLRIALISCAGILLIAASSWTILLHQPSVRSRWYERYFRNFFAARMQSLPTGTQAGLWNAGMVGYFSSFYFPEIRVINLDGVVNNAVTRRGIEGGYEAYLLGEIQVLLEPPTLLVPMIGEDRARIFFQNHIEPRDEVWWIRKNTLQ